MCCFCFADSSHVDPLWLPLLSVTTHARTHTRKMVAEVEVQGQTPLSAVESVSQSVSVSCQQFVLREQAEEEKCLPSSISLQQPLQDWRLDVGAPHHSCYTGCNFITTIVHGCCFSGDLSKKKLGVYRFCWILALAWRMLKNHDKTQALVRHVQSGWYCVVALIPIFYLLKNIIWYWT